MSILNSFDNSKPLFKPLSFYKKIKTKAKVCICPFSETAFNSAIKKYKAKSIGFLGSVGGSIPFYEFKKNNKYYLLAKTWVGAPAAVCVTEEISAITGITKFVIFGSCGVLKPEIVKGKLIVPSKAYRDEGTSYHYTKSKADFINIKNHKVIGNFFKESKIPYIVGKTWTTDAIYRETENLVNRRRKEGCICVEMESSALEASLDFYNRDLYIFFYSGDTFEGDSWNQSSLANSKEIDAQIKAIDISIKLAEYINK